MATTLVNKYVWLIESLSRRRMTISEICRSWSTCHLNSENMELNRRTFFKWKNEIRERFGVEIMCRNDGREYSYYIDSRPGDGTLNSWMLRTISIENTLSSFPGISDRIILETVPSGESHLQDVLGAIRDCKCISFTYSDYWEDPISVTIKPYFVKLFRQRWHVVGPLANTDGHHGKGRNNGTRELDTIRSYALDSDRFSNLKVEDEGFRYPEDFSPDEFYLDNYSTLKDDERKNPVVTIRLLVWEKQNFYFRSVPLHHSQREIYVSDADGYSIFEYRLQPTLDFIMDLRSFGNYVEVLEPRSLRDIMVQDARDVLDEYDGASRRSCKEEVPFMTPARSTDPDSGRN